jgi:hypothetical protein
MCVGGATRNRTELHGFAIRCITTLPLRQHEAYAGADHTTKALFISRHYKLYSHPRLSLCVCVEQTRGNGSIDHSIWRHP